MKTVVFDFDGVIADSVGSIFEWFQHASKVFGIELPINSISELKQSFFEPYPEFYKFLGFNWERDLDAIFEEYTNYHSTHPAQLVEGIDSVLRSLSELRNVKLAIVSSNVQSVLEDNLSYHELDKHFDLVRGVNKDDGNRLKPDPTILLETLDALGADFSDCVYIGDQPSDVQTAVNASEVRGGDTIQTISITTGFATRAKLEAQNPRADYIIDHPAEILPLLNIPKN